MIQVMDILKVAHRGGIEPSMDLLYEKVLGNPRKDWNHELSPRIRHESVDPPNEGKESQA